MKPWFVSVISSLVVIGCVPLGWGGEENFDLPLPPTNEPDTRPVVSAALTPPPISGGTLLVSRDQRTAVASDPDHDVVWRVDLRTIPGSAAESPVLSATALAPGDEPGRLVEDQRGWLHVVLRRGGGIATIDPAHAQDVTRRGVCPEPRGIAYDAATDVLHVACTNGDLVTLPAAGGDELRRLHLDDDLRDVVVRPRLRQGDSLVVSRFRSAELLELDADGAIARRIVLPSRMANRLPVEDERAPAVAWRTIAAPNGELLVVHQRMQSSVIGSQVSTAYYGGQDGGGCAADILETATSHVGRRGATEETSDFYAGAVLAVDLAVSRDGQVALASAGTRSVLVEEPSMLYIGDRTSCRGIQALATYPMSEIFDGDTMGRQPVAVAYRYDENGAEELLAQVRDPAAIVNLSTGWVTLLPGEVVSDSGHQTFHEAARVSGTDGVSGGAELACASCHPEGREDGRTWNFPDVGGRRTQSVAGGFLATAPFHWNGDKEHLGAIMDDVFVFRMAGAVPSSLRVRAVGSWLDSIPAPQSGRHDDEEAIERGRTLFEDEDVACATCHSGSRMTNNETVDVGTGGAFQVPSLVGLSVRAPYLHDGRAATLRDRFRPDGGGDRHGVTSGLSPEQIDDLVAYLGTL